jgi:hypothetical protein
MRIQTPQNMRLDCYNMVISELDRTQIVCSNPVDMMRSDFTVALQQGNNGFLIREWGHTIMGTFSRYHNG